MPEKNNIDMLKELRKFYDQVCVQLNLFVILFMHVNRKARRWAFSHMEQDFVEFTFLVLLCL